MEHLNQNNSSHQLDMQHSSDSEGSDSSVESLSKPLWKRRSEGIMKLRQEEEALMASDPAYRAQQEASPEAALARERDHQEDEAKQRASLEDAGITPALARATDERFGAGATQAIVEGRTTYAELKDTESSRGIIHASTGESLNLADVKGKMASAVERNEAARQRRLHSEVKSIADDLVELERQTSDGTVVHEEYDTEQGHVAVETTQLDTDHKVEVVTGQSGEVLDVTVTAIESIDEGEEAESHTVEAAAESEAADSPVVVAIDGEPVAENEEEIAEAVLTHTKEQLDNIVATDTANESNAETTQQTEEQTVEKKPVPTPEERQRAVKLQMSSDTSRYLKGGVPEKVLREVAEEAGIDIKDFRERLKTGKLVLDRETAEALQQLQRNGLRPGSPEWNTDPRNPSALGGVAKESRQLLADLLQRAARQL